MPDSGKGESLARALVQGVIHLEDRVNAYSIVQGEHTKSLILLKEKLDDLTAKNEALQDLILKLLNKLTPPPAEPTPSSGEPGRIN